jgi:hypothetical protein
MFLGIGLRLGAQLLGGTSPLALYAAAGITPQLVADFKGGTYGKASALSTFDGLLEHSRASSATYVDSSGVLQTATSGVARTDHHVYNGTAWVKEGYLHEPEAATNLVTYSQDFTDASWIDTNTATLAVDATGPDGETSAVTLVDSGATGSGGVYTRNNITADTSTAYTASCFMKEDQLSWGLIFISAVGPSGNGGCYFDLASGAVGTADAGFSGTIQAVGNGWYRCAVAFTSNAVTTAGQMRLYVSDGDSDATVDLDGTSSILIYGAQLEQGSVPTSYIPTAGSQVTRAADILTLPIENIPYPEPVVIGEELVNPADWTGNSGSTLPSSITVTDGTVIFNDASFAATAENIIGYVSGTPVAVTVDVTITSGNIQIWLGETATGAGQIIVATTSGSYTFYNGVSGTTGALYVRSLAGGTTGTVSNISVREINPLAVSFGYKALVTYADEDSLANVRFLEWQGVSNYIRQYLRTDSTKTGMLYLLQNDGAALDVINGSGLEYSPGINVPMSIASRHGSTFINGAIDGTALTANTTPTAFPDLSTTDLVIAPSGGPQVIQEFIMWGGTTGDIGDDGLEETSA